MQYQLNARILAHCVLLALYLCVGYYCVGEHSLLVYCGVMYYTFDPGRPDTAECNGDELLAGCACTHHQDQSGQE